MKIVDAFLTKLQHSFFFSKIWLYEGCRLFRDKLVEQDDISKFDSIIHSTIESHWSVDMRKKIANMYYVSAAMGTVRLMNTYDEINSKFKTR